MELVLENVTKKYKDKTAVCNISTELASEIGRAHV